MASLQITMIVLDRAADKSDSVGYKVLFGFLAIMLVLVVAAFVLVPILAILEYCLGYDLGFREKRELRSERQADIELQDLEQSNAGEDAPRASHDFFNEEAWASFGRPHPPTSGGSDDSTSVARTDLRVSKPSCTVSVTSFASPEVSKKDWI